MMDFTYDGYARMLETIRTAGYAFCSYANHRQHEKACIIRHDIDFDLEKAVVFARREAQMLQGAPATYFMLLNTEFYNLFAVENRRRLEQLQRLGMRIGLHFDAPVGAPVNEALVQQVMDEVELLQTLIGGKIDAVSFHRPYPQLLEADVKLPGIVNTYSDEFFHNFKYYSDSRMCWKQDILSDVQNGSFARMQVLVHPFWYEETEESMQEKLARFVNRAAGQRYDLLNGNFTDLASVLTREQL